VSYRQLWYRVPYTMFSLNTVSGHKYRVVLGYKRVTAVIKNIEKSRICFVGFNLFVDFTTLKNPGPF
jgi:hypothetical protein